MTLGGADSYKMIMTGGTFAVASKTATIKVTGH